MGFSELVEKGKAALKTIAEAIKDPSKAPPAGGSASAGSGGKGTSKLEAEIAKLGAERAAVIKEDQNAKLEFWTKLNRGERDAASVMHALIYEVGAAYLKKESGQGGAFGDVNSTANLLEMLSDKKAIMTNGSLPGTYRYYSASHSKPEQQGQMEPKIDMRQQMKAASVTKENPYLEGRWKDTPIPTFVASSEKTWMPGAKEPECSIDMRVPQWGIKVYTSNPKQPNGEVLPTSEIRELMFASHEVTSNRTKNSYQKEIDAPDLGTAKRQEYQDNALAMVRSKNSIHTTGTIADLLDEWHESVRTEVTGAISATKDILSKGVKDRIPDFPFPEAVPPVVRGVTIPRNVIIGGGAYRFNGVNGDSELFANSGSMTLAQVWDEIARVEAETLYTQVMGDKKADWYQTVKGNLGDDVESISLALSTFLLTQAGEDKAKQKKSFRKRTVTVMNISSPVFPVSDSKGYEVIGSYRYGRDIDTDPDGVFQALHNTDIFALLDKTTLDNLVRVLVKKESITIQEQVGVTASGAPIYAPVQVSGGAAVTELSKHVLQDVRRGMTDDQILDLGLAVKGKDPNMLDMRLQAWFADQGREGVHKVQLANVGYSLADLTMYTSSSICSCKLAEADVFLEAAGQDNFVQYVQPGVLAPSGTDPESLDRPTQWSISIAAQASVGWKMSQDALRGMIPADKPSSVVSAVQNLDNIGDKIRGNTANLQK